MRILCFVLFTIQIFGQESIDSTAFSVNLDEYVVTAQYEPTHYKRAVHRVRIIDQKSIRNRGAVSLEQALQGSPAIRIYNDPVLGTSIRMRGLGSSNVAIMVDGVPVIGRLNGAIDLSQINMQNVERIEIVEGALSNIYGNNAAGGVINIITKKSQIKKWSGVLDNQVESIGQYNLNANLGYHRQKWTANMHARYFIYDQYPQDSLRLTETKRLADNSTISQTKYPFNPKTQYGLGGFLRYDLDPESFVLARYDFNREDVSDFGIVRRPQFKPYSNDQFYSTVRSDLSVQFQKRWTDFYFELTAAYNVFDRIVEEKRYDLETSSFDPLNQTSDSTHFHTYFTRAIGSYNISKTVKLIGGINFNQETGSGERIVNPGEMDEPSISFKELASFIELKYNGKKGLKVSGSGRYTHHSVYTGKFTPSLHLNYNFSDQWSLRLGYAQGYRSPSLKELYLNFIDINHNIVGNTDLKPETSHDIQTTLSHHPTQNIDLALNLYRTKIFDQISLFEYSTLQYRYDNIDEQLVQGIQPSLKYQYKDFEVQSAVTIGFLATNLDADGVPTFNQLFDMNNTLIFYEKNSGINLTVNHRHIGKQPRYQINGNEVEISTIDTYDLIDASINRSFWKERIRLIAGARNILNVQSINISGSSGGVHGSVGSNAISPGRSYFLNISLSL